MSRPDWSPPIDGSASASPTAGSGSPRVRSRSSISTPAARSATPAWPRKVRSRWCRTTTRGMIRRLVGRPFVLVHGAGCGPWCWEPVVPALVAAGCVVHVPQLSGQEDPATRLSDHAAEVVTLLEEHDLRDVLVVGHSYGGMVITPAAEQAAHRVAPPVHLHA